MIRTILIGSTVFCAGWLTLVPPSPDETLVRRYVEDVWNDGKLAAAEEILAENFCRYVAVPGASVHSRAAFQQYAAGVRGASPDFRATIDSMKKIGDRVILTWTAQGTNTGPGSWEPTGKKWKLSGTSSLRIKNGRIVEEFAGWDYVDGFRQLGLDPADVAPGARSIEIFRTAINEIYNSGKLELANAVYSDDHQFHVTAASLGNRGAAGMKKRIQAFRAGFPDLKIRIDQMIAEGSTVASRMMLTGTHDGTFLGIPPTGRSVKLPVVALAHVRDGKLVETWASWDTGELYRQLGVKPPMAGKDK